MVFLFLSESFTCPGGYRCHAASFCVTPHEVCDGIQQCPMGDDEMFCGEISKFWTPKNYSFTLFCKLNESVLKRYQVHDYYM